ncbi:gluconate 2-dehydrogenase subunit 3 family protein [Oceanobacillus massiliensis]|uniref:gluconate 2-dehydrogenase subunit 3 family protein n=1 Tax=Oceanobacillus massiliensis TaxID=1465765 RepID=UPI00028A12AA|nr:gluconate 2-dehydrogenase subunit 3 family protein [Oceanobacillus massiliensis]
MGVSEKNQLDEKGSSRRKFLKNSGVAAGGVVVGGVLGGLVGFGKDKEPASSTATQPAENKSASNPNMALMYFTPDQLAITEAAVERIFPEDENGPGAKELLVGYYIDHQLALGWGTGAKDYTSGPFFPGEPTQGYQSSLNKQQIFDIGLQAMEKHSVSSFEKSFVDLTEEEQDTVLTDFDEDKVKMKGVTAAYFFSVLRAATIEGVYADPLYGGNAGMEGWKMKNFPGHQMSYKDMIDSEEFIEMEPKSLNSQHSH